MTALKRESFPSILEALFLLVAIMAVEYVMAAALMDVRRILGLSRSQVEALSTLLGSGFVFACVLHVKAMSYRSLMHPSSASVLSTFLLVGIPVIVTVPGLLLLDTYLSQFLEKIYPLSVAEEQMFERMMAPNLAAVLSVCILAPFLEEMLFRGLFLRAFLSRYPRGIAISASALIFGLAHLNIYQFCLAYVMGLYAGWLYERTRSLVPCILLHMAGNTAVSFMNRSEGLTAFYTADFSQGVYALLVLVPAALALVWLYWLLVRYPNLKREASP